ncbi:hypothetical protein [Atlantibacter hermannii]|uniref:Uncharacterized protein n=1 Tax=Atlantibacter hermannii NBRC 105704 TaxID=1115512 RepID=H5UWG9_ATLHE|nr:hypothetical protein EH105704_01_02570 [Atlantibacter hermannii NBRC 105704]VDZ72978.1 phage protein [Atlantibacter hermannii]
MEESRKQFEAWITEWWPQVKGNICRDGDSYSNHFMNYAWEGWQASRAAIEIELPKYHDYTNQDTTRAQAEKSAYNSGVYDSADAIRAAGLTVKGDR